MASSKAAKKAKAHFDAGNYAHVAEFGREDAWQTFAAWGLIGRPDIALPGLERFDCDEARFYSAVTSWIDGDEDTAARLLEPLTDPHARNLLALIRKPKIEILAQLPATGSGPHVLLNGGRKDPKFRIRNVNFRSSEHFDDLGNRAYVDIHDYYDSNHPPDFFLCEMVEWHQIPPNIQELHCPLIGETADFDLHIQAVYPWLKVFDYLLVTDRTEYSELRKIIDKPVFTFPKTFGLTPNLPDLEERDRRIDIWMSGTVVHSYHPDKMDLLSQLYQIDDCTPIFIDGFLPEEVYFDVLSASKMCLCYYRRPGGLVTRALETLAMGAIPLVQEECVLSLFIGEDQGVVTYSQRNGGLERSVKKVLENFSDYGQRAMAGAEKVRHEFEASRVASQYMRFSTYLAARPRGDRAGVDRRELNQKRSVLGKGWVPDSGAVVKHLLDANLQFWQNLQEETPETFALNDMGRELALHRWLLDNENSPNTTGSQIVQSALNCFNLCLEKYPTRLVPHFNLIRLALHVFEKDSPEHKSAITLAQTVVDQPPEKWDLEPMDDVMPYDWYGHTFNYRDYMDSTIEFISGDVKAKKTLVRLIYASLHYYLGSLTEDASHLQRAVQMDRSFPYFRFRYARYLATTKDGKNILTAIKLLSALVRSSVCCVQAFQVLKHIKDRGRFEIPNYDRLATIAARVEDLTLTTTPITSSCFEETNHNLDSDGRCDLSIVIVGRHGNFDRASLETLANQTIHRDDYEILYVDVYDEIDANVAEVCDRTYSCNQPSFFYHLHRALNAGLLESSGNFVALCACPGPVDRDFVQTVIDTCSDTAGPTAVPRMAMIENGAGPDGRSSPWYAFRKEDALKIGGIDEYPGYAFGRSNIQEFADRFFNAGGEGIQVINGQRQPIDPDTIKAAELGVGPSRSDAMTRSEEASTRYVLDALAEGRVNRHPVLPITENPEIALLRNALAG